MLFNDCPMKMWSMQSYVSQVHWKQIAWNCATDVIFVSKNWISQSETLLICWRERNFFCLSPASVGHNGKFTRTVNQHNPSQFCRWMLWFYLQTWVTHLITWVSHYYARFWWLPNSATPLDHQIWFFQGGINWTISQASNELGIAIIWWFLKIALVIIKRSLV